MKKIIVITYAVLSLIFFALLFLFAGYGLSTIYKENLTLCSANLDAIKTAAQNQYRLDNSVITTGLTVNLKKAVQSSDRLLVVSVYSKAKGIFYAVSKNAPKTTSYLLSVVQADPNWKDPNWKSSPAYQNLPLFGVKKLPVKLSTDIFSDVYIEAVYVVLTNQEVFDILIYGFIAVFIWLIASIIIRLFVVDEDSAPGEKKPSFSQKSARKPVVQEEFETDFIDDDDDEISLDPVPKNPMTEKNYYENLNINIPDESPVYEPEPVVNAQKDERVTDEKSNPPQKPQPPQEKIEKEPPVNPLETSLYQETQVNNLFSPMTNLGWEAHIMARLKSEITRTASFDQDMAFSLITINHAKELKNLDKIRQGIAKMILNLFLFQDLVFEYSDSGFAIIQPDVSLSQAIKEIETLQKKINFTKVEGEVVTVSVGISTRNGRLLSEQVLFTEAQRALEKALADGSNSITAFKPDPDKFREMISKKS